MTCENCGAPTCLDRDRGLFICAYCGGEFMPPVGEDGVQVLGETKFKCPTCDGTLSDGQMEAHSLLYCHKCHGMLIGMDDFIPLIEGLRVYREHRAIAMPAENSADAQRQRICPRCSQPMDQHPYGGPGNVVIDTCETCSVNWLDKGELQRIVAAPDYTYNVPDDSRRSMEKPL